MALLDKPIEVAFVADDSQIRAVMSRVGSQTETLGGQIKGSSETGRLGMWSLGESAERLAQSFNLPTDMSRQLGNSVERMAVGMGTAAVALGAVGLAAIAAYTIWTEYAAKKKRAHEELKKTVESMLKEETALHKNSEETRELTAAKEELRAVRKKILDQDFKKYIKEEEEALKKLRDEIDKGGNAWVKARAVALAFVKSGDVIGAIKEYYSILREWRKKAEVEEDTRAAELQVKIAQRNANELNGRKEVLDKKKALEDASARAFKIIRDKEIEDEEKAAEVRKFIRLNTYSNFMQTAQIMASLGGSNARKWFSLHKNASIAEATINTLVGATKAYNQGGILGIAWAASIVALGMAKVAKIRAQTFDGGGGGGVGGGDVSAGFVPGMTTGGQAPTNVVININGRQAGMYELAGGVLKEIDRNNGSIDGYSVSVERSA